MTDGPTMPVRVQRRRTPGWRMLAATRYVGRGSRWGNPHPVSKPCRACGGAIHGAAQAVARFRDHLTQQPELMARLGELAGQNLACWCPPGQTCHADVLIALARQHTHPGDASEHDGSPTNTA